MPSMPYVVTQGDINTALENAFNFGYAKDGVARTAAQTKLDTLNDLRDKTNPVGRCGNILSDAIADHIDIHWFGKTPIVDDSRSGRRPRDAAAIGGSQPTGWWINWSGPAEDIARDGMICALEVALGLAPGETLDDASLAKNDLPLDFSWICPVPRFEFWIAWRSFSGVYTGKREGVVTVTMATPGYGNFAAPDPGSGIPPHAPMKDKLLPIRADTPYPPNGHVVVGAESTESFLWEFDVPGGGELPENQWKIILGAGSLASDKVVMHEPDSVDGIAADGQPNPVVKK